MFSQQFEYNGQKTGLKAANDTQRDYCDLKYTVFKMSSVLYWLKDYGHVPWLF